MKTWRDRPGTGSIRYELRAILGRFPILFFPFSQLKPGVRQLLVNAGTEVVIEGYPRSGNTFAVAAFELAQQRPVQIARHRHVPAQVIRAARLGLPTLVLVRNPADAALSLVIRHPQISLSQALRDYRRFYQNIWPWRDHLVFGTFDELTSDFGQLIDRLNRHFQTNFKHFDPTPENTRRAFARVEQMDRQDTGQIQVSESMVGRPSDQRNAIKLVLQARLQEPRLQDKLQAADQIYREINDYLHAQSAGRAEPLS